MTKHTNGHLDDRAYPISDGTDMIDHTNLSSMINSIRSNTSSKELVILAYYIGVSGHSNARVSQHLAEIDKYYEHMFDDTDKNVKIIFIPTNGDSRIECVYPVNNKCNDDLISEMLQSLK